MAKEGLEITYDTYNGSQAFFTSNHALTLLKKILPQVKRDKPELRLLIGADDIRLKEAHEHMWASFDALGVPYMKAIIPNAPHTAEHVLAGLNNDGLKFWWDARRKVVEA